MVSRCTTFSHMVDIETSTPESLNPLVASFWKRPAPEIDADLATLRDTGPTHFVTTPYNPELGLPPAAGSWITVGYDEILTISKNPEVFSSAQGITALDAPPEFNEFFSSMIAMDDPRHARLRRLVSAGFTPRMLKKLEGSVIEVADAIIDSVRERGEVDFVVDIAAALPLRIVCDLMGIPESHYRFVFDRTNVILGGADPEYVPEGEDVIAAILNAGIELAELMKDIAEQKRDGDGTDLTSVLVNAELEDDRLTSGDLASFFILLVVAGNETTRNALSWGLHYLTDNPDQRRKWQDDRDGLTNSAVEEIVRLASPVTYMRRTLTEDYQLGDVTLGEGQKICMFYLAANRDPDVFADPLAFRIDRDPNHHLGFGGPGPHFCLGAHLARREISVMFNRLFDRLPDIEASGPPDLLAASFIHGIKHLPATFTPT